MVQRGSMFRQRPPPMVLAPYIYWRVKSREPRLRKVGFIFLVCSICPKPTGSPIWKTSAIYPFTQSTQFGGAQRRSQISLAQIRTRFCGSFRFLVISLRRQTRFGLRWVNPALDQSFCPERRSPMRSSRDTKMLNRRVSPRLVAPVSCLPSFPADLLGYSRGNQGDQPTID